MILALNLDQLPATERDSLIQYRNTKFETKMLNPKRETLNSK
jgi:hypothetical protein